jgi:UDP-GlcNAc:undecaprenyl-phosphate GlcNAc-1-phosphate transferase
MSSLFLYIIFTILFLFLELLYFRIAVHRRIIDKPNERSSHKYFTIRGGGIIVPFALISWFIINGFQHFLFVSALLLISLVSFLDDIKNIHRTVRFFFQFLAVCLMITELSLGLDWYWYIIIFILIIGMINAWNFMDGINGITGSYSLVTLGTLFYLNRFVQQFTSESLLIFSILSLLVFNFFNFRKKAKCFAGDVGSISIAFIISYSLIELIFTTHNLLFIGLLLLYGIDTVTTIIFRIIRKENIFQAHRTHFYQFLSNEKKWAHLSVAAMYSFAQLIVNIIILLLFYQSITLIHSFFLISSIIFTAGILSIILRLRLEGYERLWKRQNNIEYGGNSINNI